MGLNETLKALSDPVRRNILEMLRKNDSMSAGEIAQTFDLTSATVSYHLSQLKKASLLLEEKHKNFIYYRLNVTVFEEVLIWIRSIGGNEDEKTK
ncbi:MAG: autorepressor SdpR family transcription factor [Streptococcus sp.]|nr:autorepressor SdpR family transcription factor [Streptococcus sp.]